MKKILFLLLLPIFINGQIKSFFDIKNINSEKSFIRACIENGYIEVSSLQNYSEYAQDPEYKEGKFQGAYRYSTYNKDYERFLDLYKDEWTFSFFSLDWYRKNDICYYDKIFNEVKNECKFYDLLELKYKGKEQKVVCYSCINSTYKGKICFLERTTYGTSNKNIFKEGIIFHLIPENHN